MEGSSGAGVAVCCSPFSRFFGSGQKIEWQVAAVAMHIGMVASCEVQACAFITYSTAGDM